MSTRDRFASTSRVWDEILKAKDGNAAALNVVLSRYRPPLYGFLRRRGVTSADADDVVQEVLRRIVVLHLLQQVDPKKGRFRCFLLGVTCNVLREHRRHESRRLRRVRPASSGEESDVPEPSAPGEARASGDDLFDRDWTLHVVEIALRHLREEDARRGTCYEAVLQARTKKEASYAELAAMFGVKLQDVKNYLHRARARLTKHIRQLIEEYSSSRADYEAEMEYLAQFLPADRARGSLATRTGKGADETA